MKTSSTVFILACAVLLCGGCASGTGPKSTAASASGTNTVVSGGDDSPTSSGLVFEGDNQPGEVLSTGRGNPESLAHFAAGESYQTNGQHKLAVEEFYKSVLADPSNEELALELTRAFLEDQQPDRAVELLTKVSERPGASAAIYSLLALADMMSGKTNAALEVSRKAIVRWPEYLDGYKSQWDILVRSGKPAEGLKVLDQAATHVRRGATELVELAGLYGDYLGMQGKQAAPVRVRALALLDKAAATKFSSPQIWERMADAYARLGESKKAMDIYSKLLTQPLEDSELDLLRYKSALISMDAQDWTNATKLLQTVVSNNPGRSPQAWYYLGIMAHSDNRLVEAANDFLNALNIDRQMEMAYYRLALVWADMDHTPEALQLLTETDARFPNSFTGEFYAGMVNMRIKDYDEAVRRFDKAEGLARTNNPAALDRGFYFQIGAACERDHLYPRAATYLQKCIDMDPNDAESLNYLGFMWADLGEQLPKARAYIEKAVKMDPENAAYLDSLGWVLYKLKQPQDALPWMLKAIKFSHDPDPTILDHLGDVYMALRQPAKALESWKQSLSIEPNDEVRKKVQLFDAGAT